MRSRRLLVASATLGVLVLLVAVTACAGSNTPSDGLVGTWREPDYKELYSAPLVIAKQGDHYLATLVLISAQPQFALTRQGDLLTGVMATGMGLVKAEIRYTPDTERVTFAAATGPDGSMSDEVEYVRVSTSTELPSASP